MIDDLDQLEKRFGEDWGSEIAGDEAPDQPRAIILRLVERCRKAEHVIGPTLEALELAEEELDLCRRELKLGGSDPDDELELTHAKVTTAIGALKAVVAGALS